MIGFITGTALATVINPIIVLPLSIFMAHKCLRFNVRQLLKNMALPLLATIAAAITVWQLKIFLLDQPQNLSLTIQNALKFVLCGSAGISVYVIATGVFDRLFNYGVKKMIAEQFKAFKKQD